MSDQLPDNRVIIIDEALKREADRIVEEIRRAADFILCGLQHVSGMAPVITKLRLDYVNGTEDAELDGEGE